MELASTLCKDANVTVIGQESTPFHRILGHRVGKALQKMHEANGVKFCLQAAISHFEPRSMIVVVYCILLYPV